MIGRILDRNVVVALLLIAMARLASAESVLHILKRGDTLEHLADHYYGNPAFSIYIEATNRAVVASGLRPGQRMRIPTAWRYRLKPNESVGDVSEKFVGDDRRAGFLAEFSGHMRASELRPGDEIVIPFHISYEAKAVESLSSVARVFYGDGGKAELIQTYNFRFSGKLQPRDRVIIPIASVFARSDRGGTVQHAPARAGSDRRGDAIEKALDQVKIDYREGRFSETVARLMNTLANEDPTENELVQIYENLAFSYVALELDDLAVGAFREALARRPTLTLDPADVSPKIRMAFARAHNSGTYGGTKLTP